MFHKKAGSAAGLDDYISFFLLISQKMTDRNRKATRFGINMKYSSSYNAASPEYVHLLETDRKGDGLFIKTVYDIALSAAIFTQIENMNNNVKRDLSSGRLMIKLPASQLSSQEAQYNPLDGMSKQNLLFIKMCLQLCQSLIKSNSLKHDAKAYFTNSRCKGRYKGADKEAIRLEKERDEMAREY